MIYISKVWEGMDRRIRDILYRDKMLHNSTIALGLI